MADIEELKKLLISFPYKRILNIKLERPVALEGEITMDEEDWKAILQKLDEAGYMIIKKEEVR